MATPATVSPLDIPTVPSPDQLGPPADNLAGVTDASAIVFSDTSVPRIVQKKSRPLAGAVVNVILDPETLKSSLGF